jgi:hypothetical protein
MMQQPSSGGSSSASSKYGGGDKCPRCNKTVYFAEAREGPNNIKYHKMCFKCVVCSKVVDSTFTERQGEIYCKSCYGKEFGPKGRLFSSPVLIFYTWKNHDPPLDRTTLAFHASFPPALPYAHLSESQPITLTREKKHTETPLIL